MVDRWEAWSSACVGGCGDAALVLVEDISRDRGLWKNGPPTGLKLGGSFAV